MAKKKAKPEAEPKKVAKKPAAGKPPSPPKKPPAIPVPAPTPSDYDRFKEQQAALSRERSQKGREAGPLPPVRDPARKAACQFDLKRFNETYMRAGRFPLPWCGDHLTCMATMQDIVLHGGQHAYAMPRGSGKTAHAESGALWAMLYGHRRFVVLVGAEQGAGKEMLNSIKMELEVNELLAEDFPEVCHLVGELEGINNRCNGQTLNGVRTRMMWTDTQAVLPTVPGALSSGARLKVAGLTGRIRGMKATDADGRTIRPDLALVDDPQTDDSAFSPAQNNKRESILNGAILGLTGPKKKIACFVPCTVIAPGDMADRILDRQRNPVWHGERSKMVISWPTDQAKWDRYAEMRKASQREGGKGEEANAMYAADQVAMDAGAKVSWPEKFDDDEISGVQHAMNLLIDRGRKVVMAEFQNEPQVDAIEGMVEGLDPDVIATQVNRAKRGTVPPEMNRLVAGIDVQENVIFYAVLAFADNFTGSVVEYGTAPRQNRSYFAYTDARPSLIDLYPKFEVTARIYAGLTLTAGAILGRSYPRVGGGDLRVELCMVDTGHKGDTVHQFCRESKEFAHLLMPYKGYGITAKTPREMAQWGLKPGERAGWHWRKAPAPSRGGSLVIGDTNHWKTFVAERWATPPGGSGRLTLFGDGKGEHQLFADHMTSEQRFRMADVKTGKEADEWNHKPGRPDNHWWDCVVMAYVAASVVGVTWSAAGALGMPVPTAPRKAVSWAEVQRAKREAAERMKREAEAKRKGRR